MSSLTAPFSSTPSLPRYSSQFPEGYGDFVFKSRDGVTFHFPRLFLSHVSPVFRDMYQLGENAQNQDIVTLTEHSVTLEYLLCHIDPAQDTPHLDWHSVAGILEAAEKYQITSITRWFEREVSLSLTTIHYPTSPNPVLHYALARRFNLRESARLALRQLIKCPIKEILESPHVNSTLLKDIFGLRATRTQWLAEEILEYNAELYTCPSTRSIYSMHHTSSRGSRGRGGRGGIRGLGLGSYAVYGDGGDGGNGSCHYHSEVDRYKDWKKAAMRAIVVEPSWSAIVSSIESIDRRRPNCDCILLEKATSWKEKAAILEAELPELGW